MTKPPTKNIIREGDANVNAINTLDDLSHVASRISSTTKYLLDFVKEMVEDRTQKKFIIKQIHLTDKLSAYMTDKIQYITSQFRVLLVTESAQSRKHADTNLENKIEGKMKK